LFSIIVRGFFSVCFRAEYPTETNDGNSSAERK